METTTTVLIGIANAIAPTRWDAILAWSQILASVAAVVAIVIAVLTVRSERVHRSRDTLERLLDYFDSQGFFVRMWRMDRLTRTDGPNEIGIVDVSSLIGHQRETARRLAREALATDWTVNRADMFAVYFFALRVNSWLVNSRDGSQSDRVRLLNSTFGHQLFATLLNHSMVACRLRSGQPAGYYPTHYGLFDPDYTHLLDSLANDILSLGRLEEPVAGPMRTKLANLRAYLPGVAPLETLADPPEDLTPEPDYSDPPASSPV